MIHSCESHYGNWHYKESRMGGHSGGNTLIWNHNYGVQNFGGGSCSGKKTSIWGGVGLALGTTLGNWLMGGVQQFGGYMDNIMNSWMPSFDFWGGNFWSNGWGDASGSSSSVKSSTSKTKKSSGDDSASNPSSTPDKKSKSEKPSDPTTNLPEGVVKEGEKQDEKGETTYSYQVKLTNKNEASSLAFYVDPFAAPEELPQNHSASSIPNAKQMYETYTSNKKLEFKDASGNTVKFLTDASGNLTGTYEVWDDIMLLRRVNFDVTSGELKSYVESDGINNVTRDSSGKVISYEDGQVTLASDNKYYEFKYVRNPQGGIISYTCNPTDVEFGDDGSVNITFGI